MWMISLLIWSRRWRNQRCKGRIEKAGLTVVIVTHDEKAAEYRDRMITLKDGQVV